MAVTPETIRQLAADLDLIGELDLVGELPDADAALMRAAARAAHVLRVRVLGWLPVELLLKPEQVAAIDQAVALQVIFASAMGPEDLLGVDDRIAAVGGLSFAPRPAPRVSEAAREALADVGLVQRSGTVATPDAPDA